MKKTSIVRIVEFDKLVRDGGYPNRHNFSVDYEVSARTVARDIEYLRDMLGAPLEYNRNRNGYFYSEPWNLPTVITFSGVMEDRIAHLIDEMKELSTSEREFVIKSLGVRYQPSEEGSAEEIHPLAVA